jgi:hypothetical protein
MHLLEHPERMKIFYIKRKLIRPSTKNTGTKYMLDAMKVWNMYTYILNTLEMESQKFNLGLHSWTPWKWKWWS